MIDNFYKKIQENLNSKDIFYKNYDEEYSYQDLKIYCLKLLNIFSFLKNKRNKICIISEKSFNLYASSIGIVLSNNTWIPFSQTSPLERIFENIEILKPDLFILDNINTLKMLRLKNFLKKKKINILLFNEIREAKPLKKFPKIKINKKDISMIFFTSGSSGKSKGVKISQFNYIYCLLQQVDRLYKNKKKLVFGDYHDISFVISLVILFPCLYLKGIISPGIKIKDILFPIEHIKKNNINCLITVPTNINRIINYYKKIKYNLKLEILILCGEPFYLDLLKYLFKQNISKEIHNCYGSTELSPWVFSHKTSKLDLIKYKDLSVVPIGKKFKNIKTKIIKNELYIGGPVLSEGYLMKDQDKKAYVNFDKQKFYKTNDIVKKINDIYFIKGRNDNIVKIFGYRVELFEIDNHIRNIPNVKNCFVFSKEIDQYEKHIFAIVEGSKIKEQLITSKLRKYLPNYMIPKQIKILKKFPVNKSNKIDRIKLKEFF
jgi:D-alanine--poly(phosphoribitol) ligase subunit 1